METKDHLLKKMRAGRFKTNNGRVLRAINILRHQYELLKDVKYALDGIEEHEYLDSINFLTEEGYIKLRTINSQVTASIEDVEYIELEAKVTAKGIRLLGGEIHDAMVEV